MSNSFKSLKKNRSQALEDLGNKLQKVNKGGFEDQDNNVWKLEVDKTGNGYAVIRFLPAPQGEDDPFVRVWSHGFQGPGGWFIENSLTTLGQDDPVSEYNSKLWNEDGSDDAKAQVRKQKRRLSFYSNIYVVTDPAHPENEGKVFKFRYGKKIFDMLNDAMYPQYPDESPMNPFDLWEGADFMLKQRKVEGYPNYDKSDFATPGVLKNTDGSGMSDDQLEGVWNMQHSLQELVDPKNFKSYEELQMRLHKVLGLDGGLRTPTTSTAEDDSVGGMDFKPNFQERKAAAPTAPQADAPEMPTEGQKFVSDDDDPEMDFFRDLAND